MEFLTERVVTLGRKDTAPSQLDAYLQAFEAMIRPNHLRQGTHACNFTEFLRWGWTGDLCVVQPYEGCTIGRRLQLRFPGTHPETWTGDFESCLWLDLERPPASVVVRMFTSTGASTTCDGNQSR